jgi:UTP pyrophosphatase
LDLQNDLKYLVGYPAPIVDQIRELIANGRLAALIAQRYPEPNLVRTDRALQVYALELKAQFMKTATTPSKIIFDNRLQVMRHALGTHTSVSRVHGKRLVAKREIRVDSAFINAPAAFLKMIVVHELAHLKESEHNKAFYQLCHYMEPHYSQLEFDLRCYLTLIEARASIA